MEDNNDNDQKMNEVIDGLRNGAESEEAVAQVAAAAADAPAPQGLPAPRCPFCQVALFAVDKSGVTTYNIQMGMERLRIFTCANCDCVLPIQVMVIDTPLIAAPSAQGGRLVRQ